MTQTRAAAVRYRLRQLRSALAARLSDEDQWLIAATLSGPELRLFNRMPRFDQRHCLDVYQTLRCAGHTDPLLLRAALIHDCGKVDDQGRPIPLLYYGVFVILKRGAPWLYRWAARNGRGLLRPFALHAAHEERSAQLVEEAGSPPALVAILRDYAARRPSPAAQALHWADEQH